MSTQSNGHGGNGNVNKPVGEVVSAESEGGSAVSGRIAPPPGQLKKADFISDQEVRWCPGCGDYAILNNVQKVMPELGISREKMVFVSGIGCSSRFPYYMHIVQSVTLNELYTNPKRLEIIDSQQHQITI